MKSLVIISYIRELEGGQKDTIKFLKQIKKKVPKLNVKCYEMKNGSCCNTRG